MKVHENYQDSLSSSLALIVRQQTHKEFQTLALSQRRSVDEYEATLLHDLMLYLQVLFVNLTQSYTRPHSTVSAFK